MSEPDRYSERLMFCQSTLYYRRKKAEREKEKKKKCNKK